MKHILILVPFLLIQITAFSADKFHEEIISTKAEIYENIKADKDPVKKIKPKKRVRILREFFTNPERLKSPGKIPSFWWAFLLSAVGCYFIYGAGIGPVSVLIVYFSSHKNKKEVRKALWGWILGTIVGFGLWALVHAL